jgi:hypothetical protein
VKTHTAAQAAMTLRKLTSAGRSLNPQFPP